MVLGLLFIRDYLMIQVTFELRIEAQNKLLISRHAQKGRQELEHNFNKIKQNKTTKRKQITKILVA